MKLSNLLMVALAGAVALLCFVAFERTMCMNPLHRMPSSRILSPWAGSYLVPMQKMKRP